VGEAKEPFEFAQEDRPKTSYFNSRFGTDQGGNTSTVGKGQGGKDVSLVPNSMKIGDLPSTQLDASSPQVRCDSQVSAAFRLT
jgi:hypothetical protein